MRGLKLALEAMRKDHKKLSKKADQAKEELDECLAVGSEYIKIYEELGVIIESGEQSKATLEKLDALKLREDHCKKIMKKDICKITEKQCQAEIDRDALAGEIVRIEFCLRH